MLALVESTGASADVRGHRSAHERTRTFCIPNSRAQRWLTLSAENVGGGANKLPLRRLLMGLTLLLLGGGCCAVALRCLLGAIARANMKR